MQVEIIDFHPQKGIRPKNVKRPSNKKVGTLHVYIEDLDMDIRGIDVLKTGKSYFFRMPHRSGWDEDEKKNVIYPIVSFTSKDRHREMIQSVREEGLKYMKENFENQIAVK